MDRVIEELRDELFGDSRTSNRFGILRTSLESLSEMCEAMWSGKVKTKWSPPNGLFKKSGKEIADFLLGASKDRGQAMSRLNFYINRAGKNLDKGTRKELSIAKATLSVANEDVDVLSERQKTDQSWTGEKPTRKGALKFSAKEVAMLKKEAPEIWKKTEGPDSLLFDRTLKRLESIPRDKLPEFLGLDNMSDTQDYLAYHARKAMQRFLRNASKVYPPLGKAVRAHPENVPLYFYAIMRRISGNDMAMILFKRYFSTEQYFKPKGKQQEDVELQEELKLRNKGDLAVLKAFAEKKAASSKKFETDGRRLDGNWMGGRGIAEWRNGKIMFRDLGSRSAQTVQRKLRKMVAKADLGGWATEAVDWNAKDNILFIKG
jgi:hypothetical protein